MRVRRLGVGICDACRSQKLVDLAIGQRSFSGSEDIGNLPDDCAIERWNDSRSRTTLVVELRFVVYRRFCSGGQPNT